VVPFGHDALIQSNDGPNQGVGRDRRTSQGGQVQALLHPRQIFGAGGLHFDFVKNNSFD
jgi:hypothetical protein